MDEERPSNREEEPARAIVGQSVYDDDGQPLGTIRGFDESGFYVTTRGGIVGLSGEHARTGHAFGEAELTWRCWNCGATGDIDEVPSTCPDCGAESEEIYYWIED